MMVFLDEVGGSETTNPIMKPAPQKDDLGLLSEPVVILHSLSSSE